MLFTSSSDSDSNDAGEREEVPLVRSLYDAPRQFSEKADGNCTTSSSKNDVEGSPGGSWATRVTSGILPTEEGSSHALYYEVHRRHRIDGGGIPTDREHESDEHIIADRERHNADENKETNGLTALFLHGGPGAGCFPNHVRFFSPELYETVVLLDQRGCGRSTPLGEVANNTLELLVGDVERIRVHLLEKEQEEEEEEGIGIGRASGAEAEATVRPWDVVLGGSWGCTLALAYAHTYPRHVRAMVLRGVCLFRPREIDWLFGDPHPSLTGIGAVKGSLRTPNLRSLLGNNGRTSSTRSIRRGGGIAQTIEQPVLTTSAQPSSLRNTASTMFTEAWQEFSKGSNFASQGTAAASTEKRTSKNPRSVLQRYYNLILGSDPLIRFRAVKSWFKWEMGIYSSGFRGKAGQGGNKSNDKEDCNNVLVWNPAAASWAYEDARVWNNRSFVSVDTNMSKVDEETVQSLRRFSSTSSPLLEKSEVSESTAVIEPMPIQPVSMSPANSIPVLKPTNTNSSNATFDPTTYIPAQSMLTCYYSTNDDYCIGPFKPFLSLSPPSSIPLSSWYSSNVPPRIPDYPSFVRSLETSSTLTSLEPLPPTIAIQGGNDAICPLDTALDLHHVWNEMELRIALESGHSMYDSIIAGEIVKALDRFGHALLSAEKNDLAT